MHRGSITNILIIVLLLAGMVAKPVSVQGAGQTSPSSFSAISDAGYQVIADFDSGIPTGFVGYADSWDGTGSATTLAFTASAIDLPVIPAISGNKAVKVTYNIALSGGWGGGPGYGGVTQNLSATADWSAYTEFSVMFYGANSGKTFQLELKSEGTTADGSNRFVYAFTDNTAGWKYLEVPFSSFTNRTDWTPGPSPSAAMNLAKMWGYSLMLPSGGAGDVYLDRVAVSGHILVANFNAGLPTGFGGFADSWDGSGSGTTLAVSNDTAVIPVGPDNASNKVVSVTYNIAATGYGGVTEAYSAAVDWSGNESFSMWFMGGSTGAALRIELKSSGTTEANSNRYVYGFTDDFSGWKLFNIPWSAFVQRTDHNPGPSPTDPINLASIWGYSILIPSGAAGSFKMDQVALYGSTPVKVGFSSATYAVLEGEAVTITVNLSKAAAQVVTVAYATSNGTGAAGTDYTAASGTLTFQAGDLSKSFSVQTTADNIAEDNKTINLALSSPSAAVLGSISTAVLTMTDSTGPINVIADFDSGIPTGFVGYADSWDGTGSATTLSFTASAIDLPVIPAVSGNKAVKVTYNIASSGGWGGGPGYGGVTQNLSATADWSAYTEFSVMFYGANSGKTFQLELKSEGTTADASNRFVYAFTDNTAGWKYLEVPFSSFTNRTDYTPGPSPAAAMNLAKMWGYSLMLPSGATGDVYLDRVAVSGHFLVTNFDTGLPTGFGGFADSWNGSGSGTTLAVSNDTAVIPVGPDNASNKVVSVTYNIAATGYGGVTEAYSAAVDWSGTKSFSMWFMGGSTGAALRIELKSSGTADAASNRYVYGFTDDFSGWKLFNIPWGAFVQRTDFNPGPSPTDPINLASIWGYAILIPGGVTGSFKMDQVALYGNPPVKVGFSSATYAVLEGEAATITVNLSKAASQVVTVAYATSDGTGAAGTDYTAASGTLTFQAGDLSKSFSVQTTADNIAEDNKTINLTLSSPSAAELSSISTALLTMTDSTGPVNILADPYVSVVDDFEYSTGLPAETDGFGNAVGFVTWGGPSVSAYPVLSLSPVTSSGDSLAVPGLDLPDQVLKISFDIPSGGWGGFTHAFEQGTGWVSQDWYQYTGVSFWLYGTNSGGEVNIDIFDNKSTSGDSAERYTYIFKDDFKGWKYFQVPWASFSRKSWQPSGAPNDGLTLTEVWGYGFGFPANTGATTMYLDNVSLMVRHSAVDPFESGLPAVTDSYTNQIGFVTWGGPIPGNTPTISTASVTDAADALYIPYIGVPNKLLKAVYDIGSGGWGGFTHAFQNGTTWESQDWSTYTGISFFVYGSNTGADITLDVIDNKTTTGDSGERYTYSFADNFTGWKFVEIPFSFFTRKAYQPAGAPNDGFTKTEVWGYAFGFPGNTGAQTIYFDQVAVYGNTQAPNVTLAAKFNQYGYSAAEGSTALVGVKLTTTSTSVVTVDYAVTGGTALATRDYETLGGTLTFQPGETLKTISVVTIQDSVYEGDETIELTLSNPSTGTVLGNVYTVVFTIIDDDVYNPRVVDGFDLPTAMYRFVPGSSNVTRTQLDVTPGDPLAIPGQDPINSILKVSVAAATSAPNAPLSTNSLDRQFAQSADWSNYFGLNFWYYGTNSGKDITIVLKENRATDPGPTGWVQVWGDEFNDAAGTKPDPNKWGYNLGGQGWGNNELEYYTSNAENASTDGNGNLAIVARQIADPATSGLTCHYGPCQYTSARIVTANRFDFAYGRAEARMKLPYGQGMWPAFWMLGYQNDQIGWPNSGELDIMENVGKVPGTVYGTVHGPGYSGGNGIGGNYTLANSAAFSDAYHVFAIEWEPNVIRWYVDGTQFFTVTPADLPAGKQWVFDHPFSLLLNLAVGGGWPGSPDGTTVFPQTMLVDYVRIYQAADTSERFTYTFTDNFSGWKKVTAPFGSFERSASQPADAPNDGLSLKEVWGYNLEFPVSASAQEYYFDQFQLSMRLIFPLVVSNSSLP